MPIHHGTCHCGAVAFQADIDLTLPTSRCNCSFCRKTRNWSQRLADPASLTVTKGEEAVSRYQGRNPGPEPHISHAFCRHCGTRLFSTGDIPELGGRFASVFLPVLDDVTEAELVAAPLVWCDGLHDNWWNAPAETRHL